MSHEFSGNQEISSWCLLRVAHDRYGKAPEELDEDMRAEAERIASRQAMLESAVLASEQATGVVVAPAQVEEALEAIAERYAEDSALDSVLAANSLDRSSLMRLLERELRVEAVFERVCAGLPEITETEVELYYVSHPEQFHRPETRAARHILITINDSFPENRRDVARERIESIAARLRKKNGRFSEQALKHSECPTSLNGGDLGAVGRGVLYPELDAELFRMEAGDISSVLESPLGFHLLLCEAVNPEYRIAFEEVSERLGEMLAERRRKAYRKQWLQELLSSRLHA